MPEITSFSWESNLGSPSLGIIVSLSKNNKCVHLVFRKNSTSSLRAPAMGYIVEAPRAIGYFFDHSIIFGKCSNRMFPLWGIAMKIDGFIESPYFLECDK